MTVPNEVAYAELDWTGVETSFAPGIRAQNVAHLLVRSRDADDIETLLTAGVHYNVARDPSSEVLTVTPLALPAAPRTLCFERRTPATQTTNFQNIVDFDPAIVTKLHDAAAMRSAEDRRRVGVIEGQTAAIDDAVRDVQDATAAAQASAIAAAASAARMTGTSTTSLALSAASKNLTTQSGKDFAPGRELLFTSAANPDTHRMSGVVTAYNSDTGALTVAVDAVAGSGSRADWTIRVTGSRGAIGPAGPATTPDRTVKTLDTSNSDPATTGYTNGQTIGGVAVATGDLVLRNSATNKARNGVWVVAAAGGAVRDDDYDTYDEHPGATVSVQEGTAADTIWLCTSNKGGTLGSTAIDFAPVNPLGTTDTPGLLELATDAEAVTGTDTQRAVTPANTAAIRASDKTISGKRTFSNFVKLQRALEKCTVTAGAPASGDNNWDILTSGLRYFSANNTANFAFNIRGDSGTTLDSLMAAEECLSIAVLVTNGATPYYCTALKIDGVSVTLTWIGAPAPTAGTANKRDTYTFNIIKTAAATFIAQATFGRATDMPIVGSLAAASIAALRPKGGAKSYRYWRLYVTAATHSGISVSEMQFMIGGVDQVPTMTGPTTSGVTVSDLQNEVTYPSWKAFDDNLGANWDTTNTPGWPQWIKVDFGNGARKRLESYSVRNHPSGGNNYYSPTAWKLQGSNDNSTWDDIDTRSGLSWTQGETKTFTIPAY